MPARPPYFGETEAWAIVRGLKPRPFKDAYNLFLRTRWPFVIGAIAAAFLLVNLIFALIYRTTGGVSGTWVVNRPPSREPGILTYIMVDDIDATVAKLVAAGGRLVTPKTKISPAGDCFGTFLDPAGNLLGLYQEPRR